MWVVLAAGSIQIAGLQSDDQKGLGTRASGDDWSHVNG